MTVPLHVNEILIRATPDAVWAALTDPDRIRRYHDRTAIEASMEPGSGYRHLGPDGVAVVEGEVETVEPGRRLVMTWRTLADVTVDEPPSRVEWSIEPAAADGSVTRVRVRHYDLGLSPVTWALTGPQWVATTARLKTLLETGDDLGPIEPPPPPPSTAEVGVAWHRSQAVTANNSTWELLVPGQGGDEGGGGADATGPHGGPRLDDDAAFDLLGRAYAAAYHWRRAAGRDSINAARAAWLCSRAHTVIGDGSAALRLAETCGRLTEGAGDDALDFDRVYAVEARARALACLGRLDEAADARRRAVDAVATIADDEDRAILEGDLAAAPWFGL